MNYIDTNTFNNCCSEWDFYSSKIIGAANLNPKKKQLIDFLLTPTYFVDNIVYFDYRASIVNLLITTPLTKYKEVLSYILQMKIDEDDYLFNDVVYQNNYSVYDVIFLVANLNRWEIDATLLLNIKPKQYDMSLVVFNKYETLKQLDIYLNTNIADPLWGLYQKTYKLK